MRHWMWRVVVVVVCLLAAACQQGVLSDQDKAAIQKSHDEYAKMVTADKVDPAALAKMYYTDDAQVLPPNMPMVEGQAAIAQLYTALGQAKTFKFGPLTIEGSGGTAWVEGTYELTGPMPGTGEPVSEKGKFIEIWQKQSDESWKASRDMWSADTPPPGLAVAAGALKIGRERRTQEARLVRRQVGVRGRGQDRVAALAGRQIDAGDGVPLVARREQLALRQ